MKTKLFVLIALIAFFGCSSENDPVVTAINLSKNEVIIKVGEKTNLSVSHTPADLAAPTVEWKSSNESVATVNNGEITAKSVGEANITVTATALNLTSTCKITVQPVDASIIKLSVNNKTMEVGENFDLTYEISPENTTYKEVVWSTSDAAIATVLNGKVSSIADGECDIIVTVKGTSVSDKCTIIVNPITVTGITLSENSKTLEEGDSFILTPTIAPSNAKNKNVIWTSSNTSIATVNNGEVQAKKTGECTITATTEDGSFNGSCKVTVTPISVKDIQIDNQSLDILLNETATLAYSIFPSDAANKSVKWESSDKTIVTVSESGKVNAIKKGSATITVTSIDGGLQSSCLINVVEITDMMRLYFPSASVVSINGYITGSIYSGIQNRSDKNIMLTRFEVRETSTDRLVLQSSDPDLLGTLPAGSSTNLGGSLNSVYKPKYIWFFTYNGNQYQVSHTYE